MSSKIQIQTQLQELRNLINLEKGKAGSIEFEMEIDRIARAIIGTPMKMEERQAALSDLLHVRAQVVQHIPVNGIKGTSLFLNLIENVPPSPLCPAYNKMAFPTISTYHVIGSNIACVRLDPKAREFIPKSILEKVGPLEGKEVDLLWTAVDGRFYHFDRSLNHSSHPWSHLHAIPGPEKIKGPEPNQEIPNPDSNIAFDVDMGIFPEIGYEPSQEPGAIAINHISPMNVHVHAIANAKNPKAAGMLYSPDNAHFLVVPGSPFGIDWSVMQKDNRVAITKRLVIFDYAHPICAKLIDSIRNCECLDTHLQRLTAVPEAINKTFEPVIKALETDNPKAMDLFHQLPLCFQHGAYKEAWISHGSPLDIHGDFGRVSFEKDDSLDKKFHCNHQQRADALRKFADRLEHLLVGSQFDLLFRSQSLVKGDNVLTMLKCAQMFLKDPKQGLVAFGQLTENEQEAVRFAFWELSGCPRIYNFATDAFPRNCLFDHEVNLKVQAILLAASRQIPRFDQPIIEKGEAEEIKEVLPPNLPNPNQKEEELDSLDEDDEAKGILASSNNKIPTPLEVQEELIKLVFDPSFQFLDNVRRAEQVNHALSSLEDGLRENIYRKVFEKSRDPNKGGPSWGEVHIADDLEVLADAIQEELEVFN